MTTIKDVAHRARVAPGTVSNVLTGKRPVSGATRERVLRAVAELGYQPNALARSLVNRRSDTLAVVAARLDDYDISRTIAGIEHTAQRHGYSVLLDILRQPETGDVAASLSALSARQVDGIIWAVPETSQNRDWITPDALAQLPPLVFLAMGPRPGLSVVAVDNRLGAALAGRHLVEMGCRCLGTITGSLDCWEARERLTGWQETLTAAGLDTDSSLVADGGWSSAGGERTLAGLLERRPDLDGVFAQNDQMALGALRALHQAKRPVPESVAVVGFDNQPESAYTWPSLTTVGQDLSAVGSLAVDELRRQMEDRQLGAPVRPAYIRVAPELIVRESTQRLLNRTISH